MFKNFLLHGLLVALVVLGILELGLLAFGIPSYIFPLPTKVLQYWWEHKQLFLSNGLMTFIEALSGVFLAWGTGIFLGGLCVYFAIIDRFFSPIIFALQVIPVIAIGPFIVLWFGFGLLSKIWVVFIFALYPIIVAFKEGARSIDSQLLDVAKLLKSPKVLVFFHILLPSCMLRTLLGVKIALTYSVTSAVVAELLGASSGLGVLLVRSLSDFNSLALFGDIYTIIIISIIFFLGISWFEAKARRNLGL